MPGADLEAVLADGQRRGLIGPGPLQPHIQHALGFAEAAGGTAPPRCLDLGSGGGLPGLALALAHPTSQWVLLDARLRAVRFLRDAIERLGISAGVSVVRARAEDAGRDPALRSGIDLVTARAFGPPAVVAECAAPFLRPGGVLVVSEPPEADLDRWPSQVLDEELGLLLDVLHRGSEGSYRRLKQQRPCPDRYPRRAGKPTKRPLF